MSFLTSYGLWIYLALFLVMFCETGLVVTPFLPGDSLLFAAGSLSAQPDCPLHFFILFSLFLIASILGNQINYLVGRLIGPKVFSSKKSWLLNKKHLTEAHAFYERHGAKAILFARFIPIIRTFAPFVAGVGTMEVVYFSWINVISALLWIGSLLSAGYFLGSISFFKNHFSLIVYGIVFVSLIPVFFALIRRNPSHGSV